MTFLEACIILTFIAFVFGSIGTYYSNGKESGYKLTRGQRNLMIICFIIVFICLFIPIPYLVQDTIVMEKLVIDILGKKY